MREFAFSRVSLLFWSCLLFSVFLHFLFLVLLYVQPLWISKWLGILTEFTPQETVVYRPKDFLEDVFDHFVVVSNRKTERLDVNAMPLEEPSSLKDPNFYNAVSLGLGDSAFGESSFLKEPMMRGRVHKKLSVVLKPTNFQPHPEVQPCPLVMEPPLEISLHPPQEGIQDFDFLNPQAIEEPFSLFVLAPLDGLKSSTKAEVDAERPDVAFVVEAMKREREISSFFPLGFAPETYELSSLENYHFPDWFQESDWGKLFAVDLQIMPRKEEESSYFAITLNPKPEAAEKSLKQNFHFIIDCSVKTEKHRVSSFKQALARSMSYLVQGQNFNIYLLDKQLHLFAETPQAVSKKALSRAKDFLERKRKNRHGMKEDLFALLEKIDSSHDKRNSEEVNTVIFLTDGSFLKENKMVDKTLKQWLQSSSPSFIFHIATVGNKPYSGELDALSLSSGGKVLYSATHAGFSRKLSKLLMDLKTPIATDLSVQLGPEDNALAFSLMQPSCKLSPLFASQPTTFFGLVNKASLCTLHLQGWNGDHLVNFALEIDFERGRVGNIPMKPILLRDKGAQELSAFLNSGEKARFDQAIEWLESATQAKRR